MAGAGDILGDQMNNSNDGKEKSKDVVVIGKSPRTKERYSYPYRFFKGGQDKDDNSDLHFIPIKKKPNATKASKDRMVGGSEETKNLKWRWDENGDPKFAEGQDDTNANSNLLFIVAWSAFLGMLFWWRVW